MMSGGTMTSPLLQFAPDLPTSRVPFEADAGERTPLGASARALFLRATEQYVTLVTGAANKSDDVAAAALSDRCWEELNTGHWTEVPDVWRTLYSYSALFRSVAHLGRYLASRSEEGTGLQALKEALRWCDMGLIMGKPVLDGALCRLATRCHRELSERCDPEEPDTGAAEPEPEPEPAPCEPSPITSPLPRLRCPSLETFARDVLGRRAAVLTDCVRRWPALRWTLPALVRAAGHRTVPVELGGRYTDAGWSQRLMTLGRFVADHVRRPAPGPPGYLAQYELFEQIPELAADIATPEYCLLGEHDAVHTNIWLGPAGTVSPLHHDPKHNCLVQVFGRKYVRVYAPEETPRLYPHEAPLLANTSRVDAERPDLARFPLFADSRGWQTVLGPGDLLYMPPGWWHYVRSLSVSCSVSFWFH